jgi:membrane-bound lytic murein transglycosylase B
MTERRPLAAWQSLGVRRTTGADLPRADVDGSLVEIDGRTFLVYDNYDALMRYNCVHRYALTVAMFAEQLR